MNFNIDNKEEAIRGAEQNEIIKKKYIDEPGEYICTITNASLRNWRSGAKSIEFEIETDCGKEASFSIFVQSGESKGYKTTYTNKNGEELPLPGISIMTYSLMPVLGIRELKIDSNDTYSQLIGKKVGFLTSIKRNMSSQGKIFNNLDVKGFFNPQTNLTGSEILKGITKPEKKEETKATLTIDDSFDRKQNIGVSNFSSMNPITKKEEADDDIPF